MKFIILLSIALLSLSFSIQKEFELPSYQKVSSKKSNTLKSTESIFNFKFPNIIAAEFRILYSIDGESKSIQLKKGDPISIKTTPGLHDFQFFVDQDHKEVYAYQLNINAKFVDDYEITFTSSEVMIQCEKPVIYLYPEKEQNIIVKLKTKGELILTYPEYKDGWKVTAQPNGELEVNGEKYNYLFWESNQYLDLSSENYKNGFVISKENTIPFLEEKLTEAGLTSKEQADFITYWGPRLMQNAYNFIRFDFNESCNRFAELDIIPKPDHLYRIYISWSAINMNYTVKKQEIIPINRDGFTVVEWGGQELPLILNRRVNNTLIPRF